MFKSFFFVILTRVPLPLTYAMANQSASVQKPQVYYVKAPGFSLMDRLKASLSDPDHAFIGDDLFLPSPGSPVPSPKSSPPSSPKARSSSLPAVLPCPDDVSLLTSSQRRKRKLKLAKKETRRTRRRTEKMQETAGPQPRDKAREKYESISEAFFTTHRTVDSPVASTGYIGLNTCDQPARASSLHELLQEKNFSLLKWDGR